jgi:hypothetical protein
MGLKRRSRGHQERLKRIKDGNDMAKTRFRGFSVKKQGFHVTLSFKGKTECIDHVCARIKLHTRLDIINTKISATRIKSYYKP